MKTYIAFLRGINVSGKNKITMSELKKTFEKLGFSDIVTYINSGNVIFKAKENDTMAMAINISSMIKDDFGYVIPVAIIQPDELETILQNSPEWWGNDEKEIYDNLIIIIPPTTYEEVYGEIGEPNSTYEKISNYRNIIYWSFVRKFYTKVNWMKTASSSINNKVTIRTAGTMRKVLALAKNN